ncbi:transposase [Streptomyces sp. NPDC093065]|uniref:IS110 family transposase n=1 Tax=Streptomyces sp. NPDC093065 TaxID=3366021 RepID=UPI0038137789
MRAYATGAGAGTFNSLGKGAMFATEGVGVFLGLDVGRGTHHGHGLAPVGEKVVDRQLPNSGPKLRAETAGRLRQAGRDVRHRPGHRGPARLRRRLPVHGRPGCRLPGRLPGLAVRRIADLYAGEAKTDAKDAAVIADAARARPHILRSLELTDEITAELTVLVGVGQDLAAEATCTSNRIRGLLIRFPPAWSASSGRVRTTPPAPGCWNATAARRRCGTPVAADSSGCFGPGPRAGPPG